MRCLDKIDLLSWKSTTVFYTFGSKETSMILNIWVVADTIQYLKCNPGMVCLLFGAKLSRW